MKKIVKFLMILTFLLTVKTSWANVNLLKAELSTGTSFNTTYGYLQTITRDLLVKVKNLGDDKSISIWAELEDGTWDTTAGSMTYVGTAEEGWQLYNIQAVTTCNPFTGFQWGDVADEFVIKYEVNGNTYWDNNNSQNYSMCINSGENYIGELLGDGINVFKLEDELYYASCGTIGFKGKVSVRNINPSKTVEIVYTIDNWQTTNVLSCQYLSGPNAYGFEQWEFLTTFEVGLENKVEYAIVYNINEESYWDNNFGQNYTLEIDQGY